MRKFAGAFLSVLLLSSCSHENGTDCDQGVVGGTPIPTMTVKFTPMTDASGHEAGKLQWNSSDQIKVFVVPSDQEEKIDWPSVSHRFVTDGKNCEKNLFSREGKYGLESGEKYDWYVMSPYHDNVLDPVGGINSSTRFALDGQVMNPNAPEAHLSAFDIQTAVGRNKVAEEAPAFHLEHKCLLMKFRLVNQGEKKLTVSQLVVKAPSNIGISGIYSIDFNEGMELYAKEEMNEAVLNFSPAAQLEPGTSQDAYLVMPPFTLDEGQFLVVETVTDSGMVENSLVAEENTDFLPGSLHEFPIYLNSPEMTIMAGEVPIHLVRVTGGSFMMGADENDHDADNDEKPAHLVTLSDYYMGLYEVSQELWKTVMGDNPSEHQGNLQYPVENVSWDNIVNEFLPRLNELTGRNFCLPTEAQWEYAARGGVRSEKYPYSGSDNINEVAWYEENSNGHTQPVGTKLPNELGIYDLSGNVWEWCQDWYAPYTEDAQTDPSGPSKGSARILRGAAYNYAAWNCRVTFRSINYSDYGTPYYGFRLVLN